MNKGMERVDLMHKNLLFLVYLSNPKLSTHFCSIICGDIINNLVLLNCKIFIAKNRIQYYEIHHK
uniref:Uncharacterized protein n=1 Tax=Lepeophtheirus salmonis TaxID=72036 RepID=A0A0K2UQJ9_LEPSM